jgi:uncharacterized membrane protein YdbT with pleckstrin-like domain
MRTAAPTYQFGTIVRRPSYRQFVANDFLLTIVCLTCFIVAGMDGVVIGSTLLWAAIAIAVCLIYRLFYLRSMKFTIMAEQIIYEHGVFHKTRDFLELYRVVDFQEDSTFVQQIFSLKTVKIYSGDRSTPRLDLLGMDKDDNLIPTIRERVSANRKRNGIYEITNR